MSLPKAPWPLKPISIKIVCAHCNDPNAVGKITTDETWEQHYDDNITHTTVMLTCTTCGNYSVLTEDTRYD